MRPLFTSRQEWRQLRAAGRRAYIGSAVGHMFRAAAMGFVFLFLVIGATEPHWRSPPVVTVFVVSLLMATAVSYLLFRREWHAAEHTYDGADVTGSP